MRSYPRNSPEAAARVVAIALIADGHVCRSEIEALQRLEAEQVLGLAPGGFAQIVHVLCEDLMQATYGAAGLGDALDAASLDAVLAEIDEPALQARVLHLIDAAADADRHLSAAEQQLLLAARRRWGLPLGDPVVGDPGGVDQAVGKARAAVSTC